MAQRFWWGLMVDTSVDTAQDKDSKELSSTDRVATDLPNNFQQGFPSLLFPCKMGELWNLWVEKTM